MQADEIQSFPVALNLRGRVALVLGGGEEADQKVPKLRAAGANVTIVAPTLLPALAARVRRRDITWFAREFVPSDLSGADLVMLTEIDAARAEQLATLRKQHGFLLCTIDQPAWSDVFLVSTVRSGPIQIGIGSSGKAPLLARVIREALERALDAKFGAFARRFALLRARVRVLPRHERSEILRRALDGFAMEVSLSYPDPDGQGAGDPPEGARDR